MKPAEVLARIQSNAREITRLLSTTPAPDEAARIRDRAQLIERESAHLAGHFMETRGTA